MSLRVARKSAAIKDSLVQIDVILVGGPDSPATDSWAIQNEEWWKLLSERPAYVRILEYNYGWSSVENFTWISFLECGASLRNHLTPDSSFGRKMPHLYVFVCHGLGGVLVKQILCHAHAQHHRYRKLIASILGIVFMGVPHAAADPSVLIERSMLMLRMADLSIPKNGYTNLEKDAHMLTTVSKLYQDIQLDVSVLTVYEKDATNIKVGYREAKGIFSSKKKIILIDQAIAQIGSTNETFIGMQCGHAELCELKDQKCTLDSELGSWLNFVMSETSVLNAERRNGFLEEGASPTASLTSMSSYDAARRAIHDNTAPPENTLRQVHNSSMDATAGSSDGIGWDIIPLPTGSEAPRPSVRLPCFMVDVMSRNSDFCFRDSVLQELDTALLPPKQTGGVPEESPRRHVVLCGMGGLGKTSIAIEFAFSRKDNFDAVFWIRADDPAKLEYDFSQIAARLGLEEGNESRNPVISINLARGWLENPLKPMDIDDSLMSQNDAHWLIIFDNADSPDVLQDYCPNSGNGAILITSRDPRSKVSPMVASFVIDVPSLDDEEAARMLQQLSRVYDDSEASLQIAKKLSGLPLAISQMAAVIQHQYISFTEFLERYEDDEDRKQLQALNTGISRPETRGNISTIWFIEQLSDKATLLLELCSILDPDCTQDQLILNGLDRLPVQIQDFPLSRFAYIEARTELIKGSLITRNKDRQEFSMHRVLQDVVRTSMSMKKLHDTFSAAVRLVSAAWGVTNLVQRHTLSLAHRRQGVFPHIISLQNVYTKHRDIWDQEVSLSFGALLNEAGWFQHERGNSRDIRKYLVLALDICRLFPGTEAAQLECDAHYCLAACANETNDIDGCYEHTLQLLQLRLRLFEDNKQYDLRLAIAYNEFAIALALKGRYEEAIEEQFKSIHVYQRLPDYWPGMDTNPRTNLGFVYWNLRRLREARTTFEKLLADREAKFGVMDNESFRTGRVLMGLGNVAQDEGNFNESENWHRKAVQQWISTVGPNHHKTADGYVRVALHCNRRGNLVEARSLFDRALTVYNLRPDVYKPQIARTMYFKSKTMMLCGFVEESTQLFRDARDLRETIMWATKRSKNDLRDRDFDEIVAFWSR